MFINMFDDIVLECQLGLHKTRCGARPIAVFVDSDQDISLKYPATIDSGYLPWSKKIKVLDEKTAPPVYFYL